MQSLSESDLDRLKQDGEELRFDPNVITLQPWTNKRTGEVRLVPEGIDPAWDYNPGKAGHSETLRRLQARGGPDLGQAP